MGWMGKLASAASAAGAVASRNQESIERGIDRAVRAADERTGSQYTEQLRKGGQGLRAGLGRLAESGERGPRAR